MLPPAAQVWVLGDATSETASFVDSEPSGRMIAQLVVPSLTTALTRL